MQRCKFCQLHTNAFHDYEHDGHTTSRLPQTRQWVGALPQSHPALCGTPGKDTHGTREPVRGKAVGGPQPARRPTNDHTTKTGLSQTSFQPQAQEVYFSLRRAIGILRDQRRTGSRYTGNCRTSCTTSERSHIVSVVSVWTARKLVAEGIIAPGCLAGGPQWTDQRGLGLCAVETDGRACRINQSNRQCNRRQRRKSGLPHLRSRR